MVLKISREAAQVLFGKEAQMKFLEKCEEVFRSGDGFALWNAFMHCLNYQIIFPEWLRVEFERINHGLTTGQYMNFEEGFGVVMTRRDQLKRKEAHLIDTYKDAVLERLFAHRTKGGSMNSEEALAPIAEELDIARNVVEKIKKLHGKFVTDVPQQIPANQIMGYVQGDIEAPRSEGRPMFWEGEADQQGNEK